VATETRVFESVDSSPEAKAANAAYFAEQGITHEVADEAGKGAAPTEETPKPAETAAPKPGEGEPADTVVDAETAADWESAQTDVKRKSRYAKERQEKRELKEKTQAQERELAELRAKLAAAAAVETKPGDTAPPAGQPAADANAQTFTEPEPVEPKYEDFATEDDQLLAYQRALAKHGREWSRWDRRREKFEDTVAAQQSQKVEQAKKTHEERLAQLNQRVAEMRVTHPDFDDVLKNGTVLSMALSGVSTAVPGGLEAAYQLAKDPVKLKQFNELTAETQILDGKPVPTQKAWDLALYLLGQVGVPVTAPASPAPAGTPPAASPSSSSQPREEHPAIPPARGRASAEPRREDLSGDARRDRLAAALR